MTRTRFAIWVAAVAVLTLSFAHADTLYLRDGEQHSGRLVEMTRDRVRFETAEGVLTFTKADVLRVQLQRARQYDDIETVEQITDPDLLASLEALPTRADFPAAGYVTLLRRRTLDLTEPGLLKETVRHIALIMQQRGEEVATTNVFYFEDNDEARVDFALTVTPEGRVLHLSDAALKHESIYLRLPEYKRLTRLRFACREPAPGNVIDVQYTVERQRGGPLEPVHSSSVFRQEQPILRKEVVVIVPEGAEDTLHHALRMEDSVVASRDVSNGRVRLAWSLAEPQRALPSEPMMPPAGYVAPLLTLAEAADWDALGQAYAHVLAELPPLPDTVVQRAKELAETGGPEAIHSFVARRIRTAPVAHWSFRVTPHPPGDTAQRGLANELDKNVLLWHMLEAADIEARFALVRGRAAGPFAEDVPSLRAFNRSAVYIVQEERFVSAASDLLSYDILPGELQGVPALVFGNASGELMITQAPDPARERDATHFEAALAEDGTLTLAVTFTGTGNHQTRYRNLKDLDEQQLRNAFEQLAGQLHPAAQLESYEVSQLADLTEPPRLTLRCTIPGYAFAAGDALMMFNLPAVFYSAHQVGRPSRESGLFWDHASTETTTGTVTLPDAYTVHALPENVTFESGVASYTARLETASSVLKFEDEFVLHDNQAPATAYPDYKTCIETRARVPRQRIILMRK